MYFVLGQRLSVRAEFVLKLALHRLLGIYISQLAVQELIKTKISHAQLILKVWEKNLVISSHPPTPTKKQDNHHHPLHEAWHTVTYSFSFESTLIPTSYLKCLCQDDRPTSASNMASQSPLLEHYSYSPEPLLSHFLCDLCDTFVININFHAGTGNTCQLEHDFSGLAWWVWRSTILWTQILW